VKVLPEPVTPSKVWLALPAITPAHSAAMAPGWSPEGLKGAASLNLPAI